MVWVFAAMILVMSYSGNLKSSLVSKNYDKPTKTISEIIDKDLTFYVQASFYYYLKTPNGQQTLQNRRLLNQAEKKNSIIPSVMKETDDEKFPVFNLLDDGGVILQLLSTFQDYNMYIVNNGRKSTVKAMPERYLSIPYAMAFQKNDPSVEYITPVIEIMKDSGIVDYCFRKAFPYRELKYVRPVTEEKIRLEHLILPFFILSAVLILSCVVYVIEYLYIKICSKIMPV